jgi:hypothetical protein
MNCEQKLNQILSDVASIKSDITLIKNDISELKTSSSDDASNTILEKIATFLGVD